MFRLDFFNDSRVPIIGARLQKTINIDILSVDSTFVLGVPDRLAVVCRDAPMAL